MGSKRGRFGSVFEAVAEYRDAAGAERSGIEWSGIFGSAGTGFNGAGNGAGYRRHRCNESAFFESEFQSLVRWIGIWGERWGSELQHFGSRGKKWGCAHQSDSWRRFYAARRFEGLVGGGVKCSSAGWGSGFDRRQGAGGNPTGLCQHAAAGGAFAGEYYAAE